MYRSMEQIGMVCVGASMAMLTACGDELPPPVETVRSIRTITVSEPASGRTRRFSGVVEASDTSTVSFEVAGNVQKLNVDVGDKVSQGQVLAVLDDETLKLNVEAAEANLGRAQVELRNARTELERQRRMSAAYAGATSQRAIDQAQAKYDGARKNVSYANTRLNLARRDVERAVLRSPFDGIVAQRHVDPFREVSRGEKVFDLNMEGAMEAAISIPESEIKGIYLGLPGQVQFPSIPEKVLPGIVTEVSRVAGAANAFPVKVTIDADTDDGRIRPGMTAEVTLVLGDDQDEAAYLIPIGAIVPAGRDSGSYVYVFDAATSTVRKTPIADGGIRDNHVVVKKGVQAGDVIAVAGVSFLRDGQTVNLMER